MIALRSTIWTLLVASGALTVNETLRVPAGGGEDPPAAQAVAGTGGARGRGIVGSPHDFSSQVWNAQREICRVCHVPHDQNNASRRGAAGLLWNHDLSSATYSMYDSTSIQGARDAQPTGTAKLCLGCHDGTVALDAFDMNTGGGTLIQSIDPALRVPGTTYWTGNVGDMRSTHPISITYDENADVGLAPRTTTMGGSGTIADVLEGGKVQCASCHDVHDSPGKSVPGTHLLRVAQSAATGGRASGLCLTCHVK